MLNAPMDVRTQFPVRKNAKQKQAFRDAVCIWARNHGYDVTVEAGTFGAKNVVLGDPEKASYLVTAHYDTCARLPVPNLLTPCSLLGFLGYQLILTAILLIPFAVSLLIFGGILELPMAGLISYLILLATLACMILGPANPSNANDNTSGVVTLLEIAAAMPENQRNKVCFVLFDLEEAGLFGSASYRKAHKTATDRQMVLNLDCVGEGDHICLFPTKQLKKDRRKLTSLYKACGYFGKKSIVVREKGFSVYPSDQMHFPWGVGICALKQGKFGLYLGKIHTPRDQILEETNVNLLRAALTTFICCDAVNIRKEEMK